MANYSIYKIENIKTKKIYIGQTLNFKRRYNEHKYDLQNKKHDNPKIQEDYNKYGFDSFIFTIIDEANTLEESYIKEAYWINYFGGINSSNTYNFLNQFNRSKEFIDKLKTFKPTSETKEKMSKSHLGKNHTLEEREKIRQCNIGKRKYSLKLIEQLRQEYQQLGQYTLVNKNHPEINYYTLKNLIKFGSSQYPNTYYKL